MEQIYQQSETDPDKTSITEAALGAIAKLVFFKGSYKNDKHVTVLLQKLPFVKDGEESQKLNLMFLKKIVDRHLSICQDATRDEVKKALLRIKDHTMKEQDEPKILDNEGVQMLETAMHQDF